MVVELCTWVGLLVILTGSIGNLLCICVFFRKRFRSSVLTPFFVSLLIADCMYLTFRVIKLLYYQDTLFQRFLFGSSCSLSFLIKIYAYFAQNAPQIFIPLCHYELYIHFALLLMSFLAIQRAYDVCRTSFRLIKRSSSTRSFSFVLIINAFIIAYILEFFGLSIFCSYELSPDTAYQWYDYLYHNLSNETNHLMNFMLNQSANETEINCLINNRSSCSHEQIVHTARYYFDMHQRTIVYLIQKIQLSTFGSKMARNELRLKYHYHTCLIRLQPDLFSKLYDILYSRTLGFNRYTIIIVIGSIIPSIVTIFGNAISLRWILTIRNSINEQTFVFRRTDETRRVIIIITTECLLAIINSWFIDIILSIKFCRRSVAIGDDCPQFLRQYHPFLAFSDLLNSMSNIILYCFAARRFRRELERMFKIWLNTIKKCLLCDSICVWQHSKETPRTPCDDEQYFYPSENSSRRFPTFKRRNKTKYDYIELQIATSPDVIF